MIDLLLIDTPFPGIIDTFEGRPLYLNRYTPPLELATIVALCEQQGISSHIIEANIYQMTIDDVVDCVKSKNPQFVCLNTSPMFHWQCPYLDLNSPLRLINALKSRIKSSTVIVIGPHGTSTPFGFLKNSLADIVVKGEPELTVFELMKGYKRKEAFLEIKGIVYRDSSGKIICSSDRGCIQDLNSLPLPAHDRLSVNKYPQYAINTSRGCYFNCIFCYKSMYGNAWRGRSAESVVQEIEYLVNQFGITNLRFFDLDTLYDKKRIKNICNLLIEKGINKKLRWTANGHLLSVDSELIDLLKNAGCSYIYFGLETGDRLVLKKINKGITLELAKEKIKILEEKDINFSLTTMMGLPGETSESLKKSALFFLNYGGFDGIPVVPYPNTLLFDIALEEGKIVNREWPWKEIKTNISNVGTSVFEKGNFYKIKRSLFIFHIKRKYGRLFFINPKFYIRIWRKLISIKKK